MRRHNNGPWGDPLRPPGNTNRDFRVAFLNVNGLPVAINHEQYQHITDAIHTMSIDVLGIQELNLNLHNLPPASQWRRRFLDPRIYSFSAVNSHSTSREQRLFGGTALFLSRTVIPRRTDSGIDLSGLGRWSWVLVTGRQGINTRIVSGYRPVRDFSNRPGTVYSQHEKYFYDQGNPREPRQAFLDDLGSLLRIWIDQGEQIILGMDVNEFIFSPTISQWTQTLGLIPALTHQHPALPLVDTCDRGQSNRPIDGIWITPGVDIRHCGMTGFGELDQFNSDHRLLWMDIPSESIVGYKAPPPQAKSPAYLPINDPLALRKYNNFVRRERKRQGIPDTLHGLQIRIHHGVFNATDQRTYNTAMQTDDSIRKTARARCRRYYAGQVQYSDVIGLDYQERKLWSLVLKKRLGRRVDTRHIRWLMHRTNQREALQLALEQVKQAQKQCIRRYLTNKRNQVALRQAFEQKQDERLATARGTSIEVQQKQRKLTRQTKATHRHIQQVIGKRTRNRLVMVTQRHGNQAVVQSFSQAQIEAACSREGQRRFTQAENTPFLQGSLLDDLGFDGHQPMIDRILLGRYRPHADLSAQTRAFLNELQIPPDILRLPPITGLVDTQSHQKGWRKLRSTTASSPFGPTFSDFIMGTQDSDVARIDNLFASIPLQVGFSPTTWMQAVNVMIPKKQTSTEVEKLRIIVLFHAMYNMINKRVGRAMVHRALVCGHFPHEAFGSVPGRRANECTLHKVLAYDCLRQQHRTAALCSTDATSCYDRIVHTAASICMQRLGVDATTCRLIFGTLQQLQHHILTQYGVSTTSYGAVHIPLQGVGQGNGAGPAIWLVMTIPMINMLRKQGYGFHSIAPLSHTPLHMACFTFVDDTDLIHAPLEQKPCGQVIQEMQTAVNTWAGGLHATGGELSHPKSHWHLVDFAWNQRNLTWRYKTATESPGHITMPQARGERLIIHRNEPHIPIESLGIAVAANGNQTGIYDALADKITRWASKISSRQLTLRETVISLTSGISKSIEYPLVATRLNKTQCNTLMGNLRQAVLPALYIPKTFPLALVHSPKKILGLGLPNLWFEQGQQQVECLLHHSTTHISTSTGTMYTQVWEGLVLELGLPRPPFTYPFSRFQRCTTPTQLHTIWQFCNDTGLSFQPREHPLKPPRQNDQCLMEVFDQMNYSPKELQMLNICRLFLRTLYVSDFATGNGLHLDYARTLARQPFDIHTGIKWPTAGTPSQNCWTIWAQALLSLASPTDRRQNPPLLRPLGSWEYVPGGWDAFFHSPDNSLYIRQDAHLFYRFNPTATRYATRTPGFFQQPGQWPLPAGSTPTTTTRRRDTWYHTGTTEVSPLEPTEDTQWWGIPIQYPDSFDALIQGIRLGTAVAVTDGSFKEGLGTAAFTLRAFLHDQNGFDLVNMTPGDTSSIDSYRAELSGIYGCIATINLLTARFQVTTGSVTLACDCMSAIHRLSQVAEIRPKTPHHDLLTGIRYLLQVSPVKWHFKYVQGHQDARFPSLHLDSWAQMNISMDKLAKSYWTILNTQRPPPFHLQPPPGQLALWFNGSRVLMWNRSVAESLFYNPAITTYWASRRQIDLRAVDFTASAMALRRMNFGQQLWVPRWITSFLPTGDRIQLYSPALATLCPRCGHFEAHRFHVIRCPQPDAQILWQQRLTQLESWLVLQHTHPRIASGIKSLLQAWYTDSDWNPPRTVNPSVASAFSAQQRFGIQHTFDGFLPFQWAEAQHAYYLSLNRKTTGQRWLARLIQKLWETAWDFWRHRHKALISPTSLVRALRHNDVDEQIRQAYALYSPGPPPNLRRWFSASLPLLLSETLDFKQQWIEMLLSLTSPLVAQG